MKSKEISFLSLVSQEGSSREGSSIKMLEDKFNFWLLCISVMPITLTSRCTSFEKMELEASDLPTLMGKTFG